MPFGRTGFHTAKEPLCRVLKTGHSTGQRWKTHRVLPGQTRKANNPRLHIAHRARAPYCGRLPLHIRAGRRAGGVQKKHAPFSPTTWPGKQGGANGRSRIERVLFVAKMPF